MKTDLFWSLSYFDGKHSGSPRVASCLLPRCSTHFLPRVSFMLGLVGERDVGAISTRICVNNALWDTVKTKREAQFFEQRQDWGRLVIEWEEERDRERERERKQETSDENCHFVTCIEKQTKRKILTCWILCMKGRATNTMRILSVKARRGGQGKDGGAEIPIFV